MAKRNRRMILNGRTFYEKRMTPTTNGGYNVYDRIGEDNILKAYKYPSYYKKKVGDDGKQWADQPASGVTNLKAIRGNGFYFQIGGILEHGDKKYFLYITVGHNYFIELRKD